MTPLAHRLMNTLLKPRSFLGMADGGPVEAAINKKMLLDLLSSGQFFSIPDVNIIQDVHDEAKRKPGAKAMRRQMLFLPADVTWLEIGEGNQRNGFVLSYSPAGEYSYTGQEINWVNLAQDENGQISILPMGHVDVSDPNGDIFFHHNVTFDDEQRSWAVNRFYIVMASLVLINTPRLMGRRQHMPHKGLERKLRAHEKLIGKFPLKAWTEIILPIGTKEAGPEVHESHITGEKCLHFCRAHLRFQYGAMRMVRGHWRGNPALGIKRSRYTVTA